MCIERERALFRSEQKKTTVATPLQSHVKRRYNLWNTEHVPHVNELAQNALSDADTMVSRPQYLRYTSVLRCRALFLVAVRVPQCANKNVECVKILLAANADPMLKMHGGFCLVHRLLGRVIQHQESAGNR